MKGKQRGIGVSLLLFLVTFGIYGLFWAYKTHDEIKRSSGIGVGGLAGVLIFLLVAPVTFFLLPHEVKQLAERRRESRVSALTGLWILLPLIGPIVWFVKVQGQLNDVWAAA